MSEQKTWYLMSILKAPLEALERGDITRARYQAIASEAVSYWDFMERAGK